MQLAPIPPGTLPTSPPIGKGFDVALASCGVRFVTLVFVGLSVWVKLVDVGLGLRFDVELGAVVANVAVVVVVTVLAIVVLVAAVAVVNSSNRDLGWILEFIDSCSNQELCLGDLGICK